MFGINFTDREKYYKPAVEQAISLAIRLAPAWKPEAIVASLGNTVRASIREEYFGNGFPGQQRKQALALADKYFPESGVRMSVEAAGALVYALQVGLLDVAAVDDAFLCEAWARCPELAD